MKILLVAFLLVLISFQAAAVSIGEYTATTSTASHERADSADLSDDAEGLEVSAAIDELSDLLAAHLPIPHLVAVHFPSPAAELELASIALPGIRPPPRR